MLLYLKSKKLQQAKQIRYWTFIFFIYLCEQLGQTRNKNNEMNKNMYMMAMMMQMKFASVVLYA